MLAKLQDSLQKGKVRFQFRKVDGSVRDAYGTLHKSMLPPPVEGGSSRPPQPTLQVYWDIEASAFRSFKKENLLSVGALEVIGSTPADGVPTVPANSPIEGLPS